MNDRNESSENSESIVKWITVTILIAISVFFAILYQNTTEMPTGEAAKEVIDEIKEDPLEEPTEEDTPAEDPYVAPVITYTTFPKSAFTSSTGEYYINTGGENDEYLQEVIDFNGYYYLILETNSNGNDYNADRAGVAVAKIDYNGTIIKTVTLVGGRNETYLSSKISGMGIVIAALGTSGINYYLVSFELEYSKSVTSDIFDSIKMYYTRDYTLIAGTTGKNITIFGLDNNLNKLFSNTTEYQASIIILDIFPAIYGYSIAINVNSSTKCSYLLTINTNGNTLSNSLMTSAELIKIIPVANGYALLEKSGESIYLKTLNLDLVQQFKTLLGDGTSGDFYPVPNGYITFVYTNTDTISYHLCSFGQKITTNTIDFRDIRSIKSYASTSDGLYIYANILTFGDTQDTKVIKYNTNNVISYSNSIGGYYLDSAVRIIIKEGQIITFMNTNSNTSDYISNYGGSDIFILAKNI